MAKKIIIGVTGGLATGKTTVTDMFAAKGAVKIDADAIAHRLLEENGSIRNQIMLTFGSGMLSGSSVDRRKLASVVFFDKDKLQALCRIMHPAIIGRMTEELQKIKEGVAVMDAPLLMEAGLAELADIVVLVTAGRETQIKRATDRGISREEAERIIASQMPLSEKEKLADYIIDSDKDMATTKKGVDVIWKKIT